MADQIILGIAAAILLVASVSGRLERTVITIPMAVVAVGVVGGWAFGFDIPFGPGTTIFLELTLALVLFSDASRIDLRALRSEHSWPQRMLLIGLPLAILLGAVVAALILDLPVGLALLLGVILAPTDAALAEPVLTSKELPDRVKVTLNVESGLNDGLALPALFIAIAIVQAEEGIKPGEIVVLFVQQLGFGLVVGVVMGVFGGWLVGRAVSSGWMSGSYEKIAIVALALATFGATQAIGGSGFVATFVAGMVMAARCRARSKLFEFAEREASALVLVAFLLVGVGPVRDLFVNPPPADVWIIAVLSLVLVRTVSILISMTGEKAIFQTKAFLGWFGPRGLASIVFLLTTAEEVIDLPPVVPQVVLLTVGLSILLHGITASPASRWLVRSLARHEDVSMVEMEEVTPMAVRTVATGGVSSRSTG